MKKMTTQVTQQEVVEGKRVYCRVQFREALAAALGNPVPRRHQLIAMFAQVNFEQWLHDTLGCPGCHQ